MPLYPGNSPELRDGNNSSGSPLIQISNDKVFDDEVSFAPIRHIDVKPATNIQVAPQEVLHNVFYYPSARDLDVPPGRISDIVNGRINNC